MCVCVCIHILRITIHQTLQSPSGCFEKSGVPLMCSVVFVYNDKNNIVYNIGRIVPLASVFKGISVFRELSYSSI